MFKVSIECSVPMNFVAHVEADSPEEAERIVRAGFDEGIEGEFTDMDTSEVTLGESCETKEVALDFQIFASDLSFEAKMRFAKWLGKDLPRVTLLPL
jgi:hypothetical protein